MDSERAKELIQQERSRIEEALASLYQDEYDATREQELNDQLTAVERAEQRVSDGTYGLSVRSGEAIPDARLEVQPTAELTVEEQDRRPQ
jgi:DnaK suppressor protein